MQLPLSGGSRDLAAAAIREVRADLTGIGLVRTNINSYIRPFDLESIRYAREFNFWARRYRFFNAGARPGSSMAIR